MKPCPNCGQFAKEGETFCSNCGASLLPVESGKCVTGSRGFDIFLGIVLGLISIACLGIGLILIPILYFTQKTKYPAFMRGMMIALIIIAALILGAILTCFGMIGWGFLHMGQMQTKTY